ncbi:IAA-alanine resistance protein 1 isoform X2 [Gastrolobium bilobum]|uniref:IAA-alanine resistance protein 1 isoform X2 n=1 Tax=Gastrolobium bilobum TaxID=150636 RepID=UPI002AB08668|nr:IAA-alanine resistance protein 1 isoform X2 [Gastrolobium bilobum]
MALGRKRLQLTLLLLGLVLGSCLDLGTGNQGHSHSSGFCAHHDHEPHDHDHKCGEGHDHVHQKISKMTFGSEEEDEEDMELYEFGSPHHHDHDHDHEHHHSIGDTDLSGLGLWLNALGCSFLVSMASLICLIILPVIFVQGKPSKAFVDSLALFGAGAMLGDAFLHQLPHAFAGIVLFLLVEKIVRYVEENSRGANSWSHGHHHHNHNSTKKLKDDKVSHDSLKGDNPAQPESSLRKRIGSSAAKDDNLNAGAVDSSTDNIKSLNVKEPVKSSTSLVFGYLNLFSDGVHNFTDGMALGSAFMLYGSVGGWSRTLFLLAHELPQEVGDFGILIRSGFSIPKALFFNFLSALVALAGTALALLWGKDPGQSSLIEGFTAGGFIYIAIAGVLAEMNSSGNTTLRSTAIQIISLTMGMSVALGISLVE